MRSDKNRKRAVVVRWRDSASLTSGGGGMWVGLESTAEHEPSTITSCGFMEKWDREAMILVQNYSTSGQDGNVLAIPTGCIVKAWRLDRDKARRIYLSRRQKNR